MSIAFLDRSPRNLRLLGALIGSGFGAFMLGLTVVVAKPHAGLAQYLYGAVVLVLGAVLGWLFAPRAIQPGTRSALGTAARITALAVPLGSLLFALLVTLEVVDDIGVGEAVGGAIVIAFFGLWLFGLPLAGLTMVVVSVWIALLRVAVAWRRGQLRSR